MYVKRFSGSWFGHPFWRTRFVLSNSREVESVRLSGLDYVIIDDALGVGLESASPAGSPRSTACGKEPPKTPARVAPRRSSAWTDIKRTREKSDRQEAQALVARSKTVVRKVFSDARLGQAIQMQQVAPVVDEVVCSMDHNPRALLKVLRLKKKNEYTYLHSIAVCTLMVNVAIHLGKGRAEIRDYGLAGLLHDVGKMGVPDSILDKEGPLTDDEFRKVRSHSEHGYRILKKSADVPEAALDVCRHHHEKMDGSGYPFGLSADRISTVARLGAICDVFDALTSDRIYKPAWAPTKALSAMWSWEGHFDRELLFAFMQSLGLFAPGLTVRLRSNRLGLVLEPLHLNEPTRVVAFYATREKDWIAPEEVIIDDSLATDGIVAVADPADWGLGSRDALLERLRQAVTGNHTLERLVGEARTEEMA